MQLRFPSPDARSDVIASSKGDNPFLLDDVRPLCSQPTVALVSDGELKARVRLNKLLDAALGASVKIDDDVQFNVFGHVEMTR